MGRTLDDYGKKRDFGKTPEPTPQRPDPPSGAALRFVVHRHEARRLHYDLRLELAGVLKCWAVPRGFSYDPKDKHLAVHTEDHPLEYLTFAGVIPKGEYGAGTMGVWDAGTWELVRGYAADAASAIDSGEVKVVLHGRRVRGEWHLVRTKPRDGQDEGDWLLFKSKDRYAKRDDRRGVDMDLSAASLANPPRTLRAMSAGRDSGPFSDPAWVFELDFAGKRGLCVKDGDAVSWRGLGRALAARVPERVTQECSLLRAECAVVDGVVVVLDDDGRPSRAALERWVTDGSIDADRVFFYAFDLLFFDGLDLRRLALLDRKTALRAVVAPGRQLQFVDHVAGSGEGLAASAAELGLPGIIGKRADSGYSGGARPDWVRIGVDSEETARHFDDALAAMQARAPSRYDFVTNVDKVYWPEDGLTKGDLLAYYEAISGHLLPYLCDRPLHLNRFPDGIHGKSFYQKALRDHGQPWIRTFRYESSDGEPHELPVCDDLRTLLYLVNLGSIDLHPWLSRCATPETPDVCLFDLDPKEAPFAHVVRIAKTLGRVLRGVGLRPYLKTSGKTGVHIVVPLEPGYTYDQSRMFAEGVARLIVREHGDIATVARNPAARGGKVYVDFMQNRRGQTVVPPYAVRPVIGAQVSTPLEWDELEGGLEPRLFDLTNVPGRVAERGDLFRAVLTDRQSLLPAIEAITAELG